MHQATMTLIAFVWSVAVVWGFGVAAIALG